MLRMKLSKNQPDNAYPERDSKTTDKELLWPFLPHDSSQQTSSLRLARSVIRNIQEETGSRKLTILDLGCGTGRSFDQLAGHDSLIEWIGLDILASPEVDGRNDRKLPLVAYDGISIPFRDESIDIVYSHQVFEHVRHPAALLSEINRILKTGGLLVGSTSHLEPFHSRSLWNYTPYGFSVLLHDAEFSEIAVRPGIDGITLITRRLLGYLKLPILNWAFEFESPLNAMLELACRLARVEVKHRLALKLLFAGHFVFLGRKVSN
jgi:SAM-dependent methyltransferase